MLCGGSNYVKWVVLITFLCLCGDYEHINQHDCQWEVSKPGWTRDGAEWGVQWRKTLGNKVFFLLLCSITTTSKPKSKDSEECNESSLANIALLFQATHTNLLWPRCKTCVGTSTSILEHCLPFPTLQEPNVCYCASFSGKDAGKQVGFSV